MRQRADEVEVIMNWPRVSRKRPCAICGKPDWCNYNDRGSGCMRVESKTPMRNGGWWHSNDSGNGGVDAKHAVEASPPAQHGHVTTLDCDALLNKWQQSQNGKLEPFAATLGVSQAALRALGCVWAGEHRAFAFPMRNAQREVIGIRLRNDRGDKWAVTGSKQGLFMNLTAVPDSPTTEKEKSNVRHRSLDHRCDSGLAGRGDVMGGSQSLLIVEGPTDTAAALDLGFDVIGRPQCSGCEEIIADAVSQHGHVATLIIADSDAPGQKGAVALQKKLRRSRIVTLPVKDLRAFANSGGTREIFERIVAAGL